MAFEQVRCFVMRYKVVKLSRDLVGIILLVGKAVP